MTVTSPSTEFTPATQSELARFVADNAAGPRKTICPVGGRTAMNAGTGQSADWIVSLAELKKVIDYPARDMTITVEAGIRIDELQTKLAAEGQRLPIDIAQSERATLGGALVTNTSGPRRFGHGTFRDYVIGISAVSAEGLLFKSGGRVVKNVAGYDICKLLVGSFGTLAIVTQVTLKLRPIPETSALHWIRFKSLSQIELALQKLSLSATRPIAVEVLNASAAGLIRNATRHTSNLTDPVLCVGVEGSSAEVTWQLDTLGQELAEFHPEEKLPLTGTDADRLWSALTDFPTCADDPLTFQANVRPSRCIEFLSRANELGVAVQAHAGNGIVIGQLSDEVASSDRAASIVTELRTLARSGQGNLRVLHCEPGWRSVLSMYGDTEPGWPLMEKLKRQLDPHGLLNPGQMFSPSPVS